MKKRYNITLDPNIHKLALEQSKDVFGSENISGYIAYLINKEKQQKDFQ